MIPIKTDASIVVPSRPAQYALKSYSAFQVLMIVNCVVEHFIFDFEVNCCHLVQYDEFTLSTQDNGVASMGPIQSV